MPQRGSVGLGGFARMYERDSTEALAGTLAEAGLTQVQLNLSAVGFQTIPAGSALAGLDLREIAGAFSGRGLVPWGLSATYNMIHPDAAWRRRATHEAASFIRRVPPGVFAAITLCTGTRDAQNQWRAHPENRSEQAWRDFRAELDLLLEATSEGGPVLGIEPEPGNVVSDADAAMRLLGELGADAARVGMILDPANLVSEHARAEHTSVLADAFERLGEHAVCIHVKDTVPWEETLSGHGVVDYHEVIRLVRGLDTVTRTSAPVPLIIQDATEEQVPAILEMLRRAIDEEGDEQ